MNSFRVIPLGVGDAFSALHYTTCFAVGLDDYWILLDCPHPVRKMLREAAIASGIPLDLKNIEAVVLSHLHADHSSGLEDFIYYNHYALRRKARLVTHPDAALRLWPNQLAAGMDSTVTGPTRTLTPRAAEDFFDLNVIRPEDPSPFRLGPFEIECRPTLHAIPTCAYRIRAGESCLGFSADTSFDPSLIDWLSPCDLILHEATDGPTGNVHTSIEQLLALPSSLRERLRIFHYRDDYDPDAHAIPPLRQGQAYPIPPPRNDFSQD